MSDQNRCLMNMESVKGYRSFCQAMVRTDHILLPPTDYLPSYQNFHEPQMMYLFPLYSSVQTVSNSAFQLFFNVQCWASIPFLPSKPLCRYVNVIYLIQWKPFRSAYYLLSTILGAENPRLFMIQATPSRVHLLFRNIFSFLFLTWETYQYIFFKCLLHISNFIHFVLLLFNFQSSRSIILLPHIPATRYFI